MLTEGRPEGRLTLHRVFNMTLDQAKELVINPPNNKKYMSTDDFEYWVVNLFRLLKKNKWLNGIGGKNSITLSHTESMTAAIKRTLVNSELSDFDILAWKFIPLEIIYSDYYSSSGLWNSLRDDLSKKYGFHTNNSAMDLPHASEMALKNKKQNAKYNRKLSLDVEKLIFNYYACDFLLGNYVMDSSIREPVKARNKLLDKDRKLLLLYLCFDGKVNYQPTESEKKQRRYKSMVRWIVERNSCVNLFFCNKKRLQHHTNVMRRRRQPPPPF